MQTAITGTGPNHCQATHSPNYLQRAFPSSLLFSEICRATVVRLPSQRKNFPRLASCPRCRRDKKLDPLWILTLAQTSQQPHMSLTVPYGQSSSVEHSASTQSGQEGIAVALRDISTSQKPASGDQGNASLRLLSVLHSLSLGSSERSRNSVPFKTRERPQPFHADNAKKKCRILRSTQLYHLSFLFF